MGVGAYTSGNGLIVVPYPADSHWELTWRFDISQAPGLVVPSTVEFVKADRTAPGEFLFMMAKDYMLMPNEFLVTDHQEVWDHLPTADDLATKVYPNNYARLFERFEYVRRGATEHQGHPGYQIEMTALHHVRGPIRKTERVIVHEYHVLIASAEGSPDVFERHLPDITRWMHDTRFAELTR